MTTQSKKSLLNVENNTKDQSVTSKSTRPPKTTPTAKLPKKRETKTSRNEKRAVNHTPKKIDSVTHGQKANTKKHYVW